MLRLLLILVLAAPSSLAAQDLAALRARASARGWQSEEVAVTGRVEERWCRPSDAPCAGMYEPSSEEVLVLTTWGAGPVRTVLVRERRGEWTIELSKDLSGHTFAMRMSRGEEEVRIGWETFLELPDGSTVHAPRVDAGGDLEAWLRAELEAYLASPRSFRERLALRDGELRAHVSRVIGALTICPAPDDPGRFRHMAGPEGARGHVDTCARRLLTEEERRALLARLDAETDLRARLAREHAATWHAALTAMLARPD